MRIHFILLLLSGCMSSCLCGVNGTKEPDAVITLPENTFPPEDSNHESTRIPTSMLSPLENKTAVPKPAYCENNDDCQGYHIDSEPSNKVICDQLIKICIIGLIEEMPTVEPVTSANNKLRTSTNKPENAEEIITLGPSTENYNYTWASTLTESTTKETTVVTTPPQVVVIEDSEFHSIPVVVWVLFTIPFISIIVLGIICGRRLKMQSQNIQENLLRTTINGVHVDQLLSQRDIIQTIAFSRPPPTYEKATGEIPPGYETVLQSLEEKRQSIFQCDSLMNEMNKEHNCDNRSFCSSCGSVSRGLTLNSTHHSSGASPIIYTISRNHFPV